MRNSSTEQFIVIDQLLNTIRHTVEFAFNSTYVRRFSNRNSLLQLPHTKRLGRLTEINQLTDQG